MPLKSLDIYTEHQRIFHLRSADITIVRERDFRVFPRALLSQLLARLPVDSADETRV